MNNKNFYFIAIAAASLLTACAAPGKRAWEKSLAGTQWQLLAIQSMDDAQGTTRIADPSLFSVHFGTDGRASFRLDCNLGMSNWNADALTGESGQLTFGPIAATRALCPPPHLDERVARDMAHVRSYVLKKGKLYMSLMADGGIYEWRPVQELHK